MNTYTSDKLFVYGTLLSELNHPMHHIIAENCEFIDKATIQGRLYNVDWYPGLVLSENQEDWVIGELYAIKNTEEIFEALNEYEGCSGSNEKPHMYQKKVCKVFDGNKEVHRAHTYVYQFSTDELELIKNGDFAVYSSKASSDS